MPFTDHEIDCFFDPALTVEAVFSPQSGQASTIKIIFDSEYQRVVDIDGFAGVESSGPRAICKTSDVAIAAHGDTLVINGTTYYIAETMPNSAGITTFILSKDT